MSAILCPCTACSIGAAKGCTSVEPLRWSPSGCRGSSRSDAGCAGSSALQASIACQCRTSSEADARKPSSMHAATTGLLRHMWCRLYGPHSSTQTHPSQLPGSALNDITHARDQGHLSTAVQKHFAMSREVPLKKVMRWHPASLGLLARGRTCSELKHNDELGACRGAAHAHARLQHKHHEPAADAAEP